MNVNRRPTRSWAVALAVATALLLPTACAPDARTPSVTGTPPSAQPFTVRTVELPYRTCTRPQKVGGSLYVAVSRGVGMGDAVIRYDLDSARTETLVETKGTDVVGWVVANERWLVWSVGKNLFARSHATGRQQTLARSRDLYGASLRGDLLAWDDFSSDRAHRLVLRDLVRQKTSVVATLTLPGLYNNFPSWDGDRLLWTDVVDGVGHYRTLDVESGVKSDYALSGIPFRYPGYAKGVGSRLYSINFSDTDVWDWTAQRFGYYSTDTKRFVPALPEGSVVNQFAVGQGLLAIVDQSQRLEIRSADGPGSSRPGYRPVGEEVEFLNASEDGTLIAWRDPADGSEGCKLFLVERR